MRFLVDECVGPAVARWLRERRHDVFSVYDEERGMDDGAIIRKAFDERRILVTADKDFGEMVHRRRQSHFGVILLRLRDERAVNKIESMKRLLESHANQLAGHFVVVTEKAVRFGH